VSRARETALRALWGTDGFLDTTGCDWMCLFGCACYAAMEPAG